MYRFLERSYTVIFDMYHSYLTRISSKRALYFFVREDHRIPSLHSNRTEPHTNGTPYRRRPVGSCRFPAVYKPLPNHLELLGRNFSHLSHHALLQSHFPHLDLRCVHLRRRSPCPRQRRVCRRPHLRGSPNLHRRE